MEAGAFAFLARTASRLSAGGGGGGGRMAAFLGPLRSRRSLPSHRPHCAAAPARIETVMAAPETLNHSAHDRESALPAPSAPVAVLACPACASSTWTAAPGVRGVSLSRCTQCGLLGTTHFITGSRTTDELYDVDAANLAIYQAQYLPHRLALYARLLPELEPFRRTG